MRCENEAEVDSDVSMQIVRFLVENYEDILRVPGNVKNEVEQRIAKANICHEPKVSKGVTAMCSM